MLYIRLYPPNYLCNTFLRPRNVLNTKLARCFWIYWHLYLMDRMPDLRTKLQYSPCFRMSMITCTTLDCWIYFCLRTRLVFLPVNIYNSCHLYWKTSNFQWLTLSMLSYDQHCDCCYEFKLDFAKLGWMMKTGYFTTWIIGHMNQKVVYFVFRYYDSM